MWAIANIPTQTLMKLAVPLYTVGIGLLVGVALFGLTRKGAKRWINVGVVIQPSEVMKIAMPLMLAWYYQKRESNIRWCDYVVGFLILVLPVGLIAKQPDLGTAVLVFAAGMFVIYFAGLSLKLIVPVLIAGLPGPPHVVSVPRPGPSSTRRTPGCAPSSGRSSSGSCRRDVC